MFVVKQLVSSQQSKLVLSAKSNGFPTTTFCNKHGAKALSTNPKIELIENDQQITKTRPSIKDGFSETKDVSMENKIIRWNLALAYRELDRLKLNEGVCNHLSAMAPARNQSGETMLVIPGSVTFYII